MSSDSVSTSVFVGAAGGGSGHNGGSGSNGTGSSGGGGGGGGGTKNLTRSTSFAIRKNKLNTVKEKTPSCILGRRADICVW